MNRSDLCALSTVPSGNEELGDFCVVYKISRCSALCYSIVSCIHFVCIFIVAVFCNVFPDVVFKSPSYVPSYKYLGIIGVYCFNILFLANSSCNFRSIKF